VGLANPAAFLNFWFPFNRDEERKTEMLRHKPEPNPAQAPLVEVPLPWRNILPIHPAAEMFPLMNPGERRALADDIDRNDLQDPVILYRDPVLGDCLVDGRNRLDALELLGQEIFFYRGKRKVFYRGQRYLNCHFRLIDDRSFDPYAYVISKNIHRRHLTAEQRRDLIAKVLKAKPDASNLQIAKQVKADDKTVAKVRSELESRSEIPNVETRTDSKGRKQQAHKQPTDPAVAAVFKHNRAAKLGEDTVARLHGTSLGTARELDELIVLNRGSPHGELNDIVRKLVDDAVAGKAVSAIATGAAIENGAPVESHDYLKALVVSWNEVAAQIASRNRTRLKQALAAHLKAMKMACKVFEVVL
jgi:hypothetical protein